MDQLHLLFLLSFSMLIGSFLSGTVPMAFKMSDAKSRLLALMGSGILVGTALAIIIPEGIDALYNQPASFVTRPQESAGAERETHNPNKNSDYTTNKNQVPFQEPVQAWYIGISLVTGFVLMLFIDQFSIYQSENDSPTPATHDHAHDYSLANQDESEVDNDDDEILFTKRVDTPEITSDNKPINEIDTHRILMSNTDSINHHQAANGPSRFADTKQVNRIARKQKVTPTLGLVIHAAADGIALGAAASTSHRDTEMIIFLAIMLHKAPAAFSLVVFLLHRGLKHSTIRRQLLAFSFSAPLAAVLTFFGLSQSGKEALRRNNTTGIVMLFSAGTFLYVATIHVLPELVNNTLLTPKEMLFLVGGAFLPILLAQTI